MRDEKSFVSRHGYKQSNWSSTIYKGSGNCMYMELSLIYWLEISLFNQTYQLNSYRNANWWLLKYYLLFHYIYKISTCLTISQEIYKNGTTNIHNFQYKFPLCTVNISKYYEYYLFMGFPILLYEKEYFPTLPRHLCSWIINKPELYIIPRLTYTF